MYVSPPIQCVPFWPELTNKKLQMLAKVKDTKEETKAFYMNQAHTTLLPLNNDVGISVSVWHWAGFPAFDSI